MSQLRSQVINLYKNLLYYANDYPLGYTYFRNRLKKAFLSNKSVQDKEQVEKLIARGEFVIKEIEALYKLKKYRTLKRNYYDKLDDDYLDSLDKLKGAQLQNNSLSDTTKKSK